MKSGTFLFLCCFCALLFAANTCYSQSNVWYRTRGGTNLDESWGVDVDSAGNVYWATCEIPPTSLYFDINLYKIDSTGHQIWKSKSWGGAFNDKAFVTAVKAPYVYVAGRSDTSGDINSAHALVLAYDIDSGKLAWQYTWDQGYGYQEVDGLVIDDSAIYISGWTAGDTTSNDMFIQKLSKDGKLIWSQTWGSKNWDEANGHMVVDANNIYVAGRYNASGELSLDGDAVLACFRKSDGAYQWHKTWGGASYDDAYGMTASADSFLYITGLTYSFGGSKIFLLKYTKTGTLVWDTLWGGAGGQAARALYADGDSVIYVGGKTDSYGAGVNDLVLLKYDTSGHLINYKAWGGTSDDQTHDIAGHNGIIYFAGETSSFSAGKSDALLLKANGRTSEFPSTQTTVQFSNDIPQHFSVAQNYPNPFSEMTNVEYRIPVEGLVTLKVFNTLGEEVATLVNGKQSAGEHSAAFNAIGLQNGIYFYRLAAGRFSQSGKMTIIH